MRNLFLAGLFMLVAPGLHASETASFLNIGVGARALGMGGAYTALAEDANAIYWNPAGLASVERQEMQASHAELAQTVRHDFVGYANAHPAGTFAASLTYLSQESLDGRDALGHPTGGFSASDAAAAAGYGRKTDIADFGASVKYIRSHIGSAEAQTFAIDLGARKALGPVVLGAALRNAGPGMKFDSERNDLPLRLAFGAAYKFAGGHAVAAELINRPRGSGSDVGLGGEYRVVSGFMLRAGYTTQTSISGGGGFDAASGLTLGLGYRRDDWNFDYAAVPMGELGSTHRFTFGIRF